MTKISIIIPNYNKGKFITETLNSLINQTYENWEAIIVDDGSNDNSKEIILKFSENDSRIFPVFLSNSENGGSYCRNIGLKKSKGEYIIFLDSDDVFHRDTLKNRLKYIAENKENFDGWIFPMEIFRERIGDSSEFPIWNPIEKDALVRFLSHDLPWQTMQPIWKKQFVFDLNGFDETYARYQDVEFHTRALLKGAKVSCNTNAIPDCYYRISSERIIINKLKFLENKATGSYKYYTDFFNLINVKHRKYLSITLLKAISEILYFSKKHGLDSKNVITSILNSEKEIRIKKLLFIYSKIVSNSKYHIPGLEKLFNILIRTFY